jgi:hypothetical protein
MRHTAARSREGLHKALPNTRFVKLPRGLSRVFSFKATRPVSPGPSRVYQCNRYRRFRQPLFSNFRRMHPAANSLKILGLSRLVKG